MSTSSSNLQIHKNLAREILNELENISGVFSRFQNSSGLTCAPGCGKCCFKPDIFCTPLELLPLAIDLLNRGEAEAIYEECRTQKNLTKCMFMNIEDEKSGKGKCTEYKFRPLVCRIFGVAGLRDKNGKMNFSVCSTLKDGHSEAYENFLLKEHKESSVPFVENYRGNLTNLDPRFLEQEFPINESLKIILDKVLLYSTYEHD